MDNNIGNKIKKRRVELGMTLKELSQKCGILPQLISDYENNRKEPGLKNLRLLCNSLGVTANYILDTNNGFDTGKINTYGNVLSKYFEALEISKKDELEINKDTMTVDIHIKDPVLVKILLQSKDMLEIGGDVAKTIKNFNVNLLYSIEVDENKKY